MCLKSNEFKQRSMELSLQKSGVKGIETKTMKEPSIEEDTTPYRFGDICFSRVEILQVISGFLIRS